MYLSIDSKLQINVDLTVAMKCESKFFIQVTYYVGSIFTVRAGNLGRPNVWDG